ncbi:MAG: peptidylprolyl isomerase [Bacteroidales bacterium]|nr:peptidylprolyl isomerase [Bacteroidales bacterium]MCI5619708.1 peptidylprolyl isomerase [Rikenellaceae bacterium]
MKAINRILAVSLAMLAISVSATAQRYQEGLVDKTVAVIGNEAITISDLEAEVQVMRAQGSASDMRMRCDILQQMMESKLFLMQARVDSLTVNADMVETQLSQRIDQIRATLGGDENVAEYFGKPVYKLRQEWKQQLEDMSLTQQEQSNIAGVVPPITPYDVKKYIESVDESKLPIVPDKYQLSQICVYPDREAAANAVKEKLIELRERIHNGDKFATLARMYSEDIASARKGGELGMTPKSQFWPQFSDAAMALRPGVISQVVETPDGFHIIEMLEKKGDDFNARHILMRPVYTAEDQEKGFALLDSLRSEIMNKAVTFELAARFYSEDSATKTNGGQMADPNTGSAYFEVDQLKPQDYEAIKDLKVGEISQPFASLDNEGRDGNLVYKIVRLDKVVPSHVATFENDFTQLSEMVMNDKQQEAIDKFIDEKLKTTYIVIDPLFKDCQFDRTAWNDKIRSE